MSETTTEVLNRGMRCLLEKMGVVETEKFISIVIREQFDYTKWQKDYFDSKTPDEINREALDFNAVNPYKGTAKKVL